MAITRDQSWNRFAEAFFLTFILFVQSVWSWFSSQIWRRSVLSCGSSTRFANRCCWCCCDVFNRDFHVRKLRPRGVVFLKYCRPYLLDIDIESTCRLLAQFHPLRAFQQLQSCPFCAIRGEQLVFALAYIQMLGLKTPVKRDLLFLIFVPPGTRYVLT